jgi:putative flavoprotein involved in K+ transport
MSSADVDVAVIGGGQAGLAMGHQLARRGRDAVILDAHQRVGESWRERWDSLVLFTEARFAGLPGMPFPGPARAHPTKDQVADYLAGYAERFRLPVQGGVRVDRVLRHRAGFELRFGPDRLLARAVVLATGAHQRPVVPALAGRLDTALVQLHSSGYRAPGQLPRGPVLVVGAGNSGAEIALELARAGRRTTLAGPDTGALPTRLLGRTYWWLVHDVLTLDRRVGRRVLSRFRGGGSPLIRTTPALLAQAGVERVGRITDVRGGRPVPDGRGPLDVASVVWCTGFAPDFGLLDLPLRFADGYPVHQRGVVAGQPGLYLLGTPLLYALTSSFLGGVGRDAAYLADRIAGRPAPGSAAAFGTAGHRPGWGVR